MSDECYKCGNGGRTYNGLCYGCSQEKIAGMKYLAMDVDEGTVIVLGSQQQVTEGLNHYVTERNISDDEDEIKRNITVYAIAGLVKLELSNSIKVEVCPYTGG